MKVKSQAPCRLGLFGGGTDVNPYAEKYGGFCLNLAINIRQHIEMEDGNIWKLEDYDNPNFFSAFADHSLAINHDFDNTIESGLGSSASLGVALVGALNRFRGLNILLDDIIRLAWDIEVNKIGLYGGMQDQIAAGYGGVNAIEFGKEFKVTPLGKPFIEKLLPSLTLFYLGKNRRSANIQNGFKNPSAEQIRKLDAIKKIAYEALDPIAQGDIERVGYLFSKAWDLKKKSNKGVSDDFIDRIYQRGIEYGALGGKIQGAGGGGHFLFIVPPEKRQDFIENMEREGVKWVDFSIDWNGLDTRICEH